MKKSDQEEALNRKAGDWVWCLHCERAYQVGEFKINVSSQIGHSSNNSGELQLCPYPDCDGDTVIDSWEWESIKEKHPDYPVLPERDKVYPMY
jgi:hypothetical protein